MTKHTPGPWAVRRRDSLVPSHMIMAPGKDTPIAIIRMTGPDTDDYDESEEIANARFIAAAPDMEKALEMYVQAEDSEPSSVEQFAWAGDAARVAIAKARGETESTPGPWRESSTRMLDILQVTDPACCGMRLVDEDGCCVTCGRDFFDPDTGEEIGDGTRVPNARLRDAAFDLLDALNGVVRLTKVQHVLEKWELGSLNALIAKAKGEGS